MFLSWMGTAMNERAKELAELERRARQAGTIAALLFVAILVGGAVLVGVLAR